MVIYNRLCRNVEIHDVLLFLYFIPLLLIMRRTETSYRSDSFRKTVLLLCKRKFRLRCFFVWVSMVTTSLPRTLLGKNIYRLLDKCACS